MAAGELHEEVPPCRDVGVDGRRGYLRQAGSRGDLGCLVSRPTKKPTMAAPTASATLIITIEAMTAPNNQSRCFSGRLIAPRAYALPPVYVQPAGVRILSSSFRLGAVRSAYR